LLWINPLILVLSRVKIMIMQIRRIIALTMATVLMIVTLGRYNFNATGLPKYSESSLFERIAISLKIGKTRNGPQVDECADNRADKH
jgi:hypothetical protein